MIEFNSISWKATIGLVPGYSKYTLGYEANLAAENLIKYWPKVMDSILEETGFLLSMIIHSGYALYPTSMGCPEGGEPIMVLSGCSNPKFVATDKISNYMGAVNKAIEMLQDHMKQITVMTEFTPILAEYSTKVER